MKKIRLGKTNLMVSEIGFGGIPITRVSKDEAVKTIKKAIDLGINFIDTANAYKDSEEKIGYATKGIRDELIIATKSTRRYADQLHAHIDNSLKMLQTDYIDIFQIHQVSKDEDVDRLFKEDGPYEAALKAQNAGKILHIGITSHRLETALWLVKTDKFETIQFPGNFVEVESFETLFPEARKRDMGCIVMKPLGGGDLASANLCFKFLQQYPECIPIPGMAHNWEVEEIIELYKNKTTLTAEEISEIEKIKNEAGKDFCRRCAYCEPCPQGVSVFAAMASPRLLKNYGPHFDAAWFIEGMKSIDNCVNCGLCETRCPYSLPIRDTLRKNKDFYNKIVSKQ